MSIKDNKGLILGIGSGILVFIIALMLIIFNNSDFDQQLIKQVDSGVPADKLIPQIDRESTKMKSNAQKNLESYALNKNLSNNDSDIYEVKYKEDIRIISEYNDARKKFANREITKEQFLNEIKNPKDYIKIYNYA